MGFSAALLANDSGSTAGSVSSGMSSEFSASSSGVSSGLSSSLSGTLYSYGPLCTSTAESKFTCGRGGEGADHSIVVDFQGFLSSDFLVLNVMKIFKINGVSFDWNEKSDKKGHDVGVIAQEIEKVLPELVVERDSGYKAVRYEKIVALLLEAIKQQQLQIDELKSKI